MPGGGIHERNLKKIVTQSGVREVHMTARREIESRMTYRNPNPYMGGALRPPEFSRLETDAARVRGLIDITRA
jgi:copper homeostasis protein